MVGQTQPAVRFVNNSQGSLDKKATRTKFMRPEEANKFVFRDCKQWFNNRSKGYNKKCTVLNKQYK